MHNPRFMIAAPGSGSGKTMVTCGILEALIQRGLRAASFKCGPDYIDPMFHTKVLGTHSRNLDTFFTGEEMTRHLFLKNAAGADISVMEGVMGYYDGLGGVSVTASAYDLARVTRTPVILLADTKGMSVSVIALIRGFLEYRKESFIKGVILNRMSRMLYPEIKRQIEEELGIKVYGYVETMKDFNLESRHLGLVMPGEIEDLNRKLQGLAARLEETLDIGGLLALAESAPVLADTIESLGTAGISADGEAHPCIAAARDEAFCFLYEDNLELLRQCGARIIEFSPLHDREVPKEAAGLLLYGGYPELYAKELSENVPMKESIKAKIDGGMPCMAECGGFMYLHDTMEDMEKKEYPMAGVIHGKAYKTDRLGRFGYIELTPEKEQMLGMDLGTVKGHEFHYFDSTACGDCFTAKKPLRDRSWKCIQGRPNLLAGFPHLYYYSNPQTAERFVKACSKYGKYGKYGKLEKTEEESR